VTEAATTTGMFIAFEGGEGAGKTTQIALLAEALQKDGVEVVVTREPGGTALGVHIRQLLLSPDTSVTARAEALLFAADRADHVETVIRPALRAGAVVVTDRYVDSSLAYQGAGRAISIGEVEQLAEWATGGLRPDLTVLLDIDVPNGLARAGRRSEADRLETEPTAFHESVRQGFLSLARAGRGHYLVIDATRPVQDQAEEIVAEVRSLRKAYVR